MAFTTITNAELVGKGVKSLPDTPDMAASELKQQFDSLGDLCVSHIRTLVSELQTTTAAISLGAVTPAGLEGTPSNVQDIINALATIVAQLEELRHTHGNKAVLDTISETNKEGYDSTVLKFDTIRSVEIAVHDADDEIPTSGAVVDYVNARLAELGLGG